MRTIVLINYHIIMLDLIHNSKNVCVCVCVCVCVVCVCVCVCV